jgi:hypothetical protein
LLSIERIQPEDRGPIYRLISETIPHGFARSLESSLEKLPKVKALVRMPVMARRLSREMTSAFFLS